jgi:magnesium transporter
MEQEEVAYIFRQYYLVSAPVVGKDGRLIGFISVEDIVDIIEEEAEEDLMLLGGVQERDTYFALTKTVKKRFPWLWINLLTSFGSAFIISQFAGSIAQMVVLAALMPVVAAVVGNAGMQTLTVVVRGIARKQITGRNKVKVIFKEFAVCAVSGILLGVIGAIGVFAVYMDIKLAGVFGGAIACSFVVAGLVGSMVPIIFKRLKIDPAIASSAFVVTATDMTSFLVFLGLATIFLM